MKSTPFKEPAKSRFQEGRLHGDDPKSPKQGGRRGKICLIHTGKTEEFNWQLIVSKLLPRNPKAIGSTYRLQTVKAIFQGYPEWGEVIFGK